MRKKRSLESSLHVVVLPNALPTVLQSSLRLPRSTNGPMIGA